MECLSCQERILDSAAAETVGGGWICETCGLGVWDDAPAEEDDCAAGRNEK